MIFKRMVAVMISTVMFGAFSIIPNNYFYLTTSATQSMSGNFYGGYTLTGDGAADTTGEVPTLKEFAKPKES